MFAIQRIYARNTELRDLSGRKHRPQVQRFLEDNHLQGKSRGNTVAYGLFHGGELVQLMTFGKPRFNRNFEWELIRECSRKNTQVVGGASKLFKRFVTDQAPLSVVVYTAVKDTHLFEHANHYVNHMGFMRYEESRLRKEQSFVSREWPRKDSYGRSYSASSVYRTGPDRLLGTKLGFQHGTNKEIMLELGYDIVSEEALAPHVDAWLSDRESPEKADAVGYIYRADCSCGGVYIGISERLATSAIKSYISSGSKWVAHLAKHPDHTQSKTILRWYDSPEKLREAELKLVHIAKKIFKGRVFNLKETAQGIPCAECGNFGRHLKSCSLYTKPGIYTKACEECGGLSNHHRASCSLFVERRESQPCGECQGKRTHRAGCSKKTTCSECGSGATHRKGCSQRIEAKPCLICGSKARHRKTCKNFVETKACEECGSKSRHKKKCSFFKPPIRCLECGASGNHRASCSFQMRVPCEECGSLTRHKSSCSRYTPVLKKCSECGAGGVHFKSCSKYRGKRPCAECGSMARHRQTCSLRR